MPIPFLAQLAIAVFMMVVSIALRPKVKQPKPEGVKDLEEPTAEAGRTMSKVWGTITIKDGNVLWHGDKATETIQVKA